MTEPNLATALKTVNGCKLAAGMVGPSGRYDLDDHRAFLAGTDLDPADVNAATAYVARDAAPSIAEAADREEFVQGIRGLWLDGVVHGLELARQRDEVAAVERRERDRRLAAAIEVALHGAMLLGGDRDALEAVARELRHGG